MWFSATASETTAPWRYTNLHIIITIIFIIYTKTFMVGFDPQTSHTIDQCSTSRPL